MATFEGILDSIVRVTTTGDTRVTTTGDVRILSPDKRESALASDALLVQWNSLCDLAESVGADDAYVLAQIYDKIISESVNAFDSVVVDGIYKNAILVIEDNDTFAVGDILYMKARTDTGTDAEWLEVVNIDHAPSYRVIRDKAGMYADGSNPEWTKGAAVANYGQAGDGGIYVTAVDTNAPHLSIFTHAGEPWNAITTHIREGNLNGFLGYDSDLYGIAIGETDAYLKYDPTNGLRIKGTIAVESMYALPSDEHLVGYWAFDDGSGSVAVDGSPSGSNDGTLVNMEDADWVDGVVGKCLEFDGVDEYVNCGDDSIFDFTSEDFSVAFWMKRNGDSTSPTRMIHRETYNAGGWQITHNTNNSIVFRTDFIGSWDITTSTAVITGTTDWYFITVVRSGTSVKIYSDAIDITSSAGVHVDPITTTLDLTIGGTAARRFNGLIDEVRIYSTALTASEVKALYLYPAGNKGSKISGAQTPWSHVSDVTMIDGGNIQAGTINLVGGVHKTAASGRKVQIDSGGIKFITGALTGKYGSNFKYGDGTKYGDGALAYFYNTTTGMPFYVNAEQTIADMHLYNRSSNPSGVAEVGDICVVGGKLMICTVANTPGTWTVAGDQAA